MKRLRILISGRVQGVFFRVFVADNANKLGVKGWVRNTRDGNVEAVFEGEDKTIDKLVGLCKKGPGAAKVDNLDLEEEKYTGEFDSFDIVY